ncbi:PAS domain-containing sensor histidine kinase [Croceicoccus marinus]|uniref:histidine kinase n=1 Tax=Croceicoccus marinus TaxID=450378 RepID=A0A1Z1F950_9SPHN|nr:PAS domain-containing sensor histidine kinase [Croceicoccus marinus]ARU15348.1 sensor histidine kinase [Croceicoccus marinus]
MDSSTAAEGFTLGLPALLLIGLLLAAWTAAAGLALVVSRRKLRRARRDRRANLRLSRMIDESPALPLLVRSNGRIEASERLAAWFGCSSLPQHLHGLAGPESGLPVEEAEALWDAVEKTRSSAAPLRMMLHPGGANHALSVIGHLADPQVAGGGAVMLWVSDASDSAEEIARLSAEAERSRHDFHALVGLIEAAPVPMWFRDTDGRLRLVNSAYVAAVGADSAEDVVSGGIELVETVGGMTATEVAEQAKASQQAVERQAMITIDGERRAFRVSDLPVGNEGVAGYAVDVEDLQLLEREYRAFRNAQRALLDQMSSGVAQFDHARQLVFTNLPMQRIFRLPPNIGQEALPVGRIFDMMRNAGRLPEVRDFPAWRAEREGWFTANDVKDEEWVLADGTHLRVVAQPMPDGGLVMIFEDRTEQLKLASARDTLLRTRTATFDNLFEGLVVLAPDGRLQIWNRRFAAEWNLREEVLAGHPHIDALLEGMAPLLRDRADTRRIRLLVEAATLQREQTTGRVTLADGRTLALAGVPLPDGNGMLTSLDITDAQKAEAALIERNEALVEADAVKTRFLANMSYEFRTPLTSITGFAEMLRAGVAGEMTETGREYVTAILDSTARLSQQIEAVLDLTQSEAGLMPMAEEDVELMPLVTGLVQDRSQAIEQADITFNLRGDRTSGLVSGDERQLARAIGNLIDNAIASSPRGGRINMDLRRRRDGVAITITHDNAQEGVSGSADTSAGLNLPLARELIEAHKGSLDHAQDARGRVVVTVVLP